MLHGDCYWKPDRIKINGKLRFTTSCGEHWFTSGGIPFHICPFCNKSIWFQDENEKAND